MGALLRLLLIVVGGAAVAWVAGQIVARKLEEGNEFSDEFRRVVLMNGTEFKSRAGGLRDADVRVALGGAKVDLREATLDPAGATITAEATLGGLAILVRDDWAVTVENELINGEAKVDVTDPDDLPEDAPRLRIEMVTRYAGSLITTGDPEAAFS